MNLFAGLSPTHYDDYLPTIDETYLHNTPLAIQAQHFFPVVIFLLNNDFFTNLVL
jgi:hypothetical protein